MVSFFIARWLKDPDDKVYTPVILRLAFLSVMLSILIMVVSVCVMSGYKREINDKLTGFSSDIQILGSDHLDTYDALPVALNRGMLDSLSLLPVVKHVQPVVFKPGIIKSSGIIDGLVVKGINQDFDTNFFYSSLLHGRMPSNLHSNKFDNEILISASTSARLRLKVGQKVVVYFSSGQLRARPFTICGIYETGLEEFDKLFAVCDLRILQKINNWTPDQYSAYEFNLKKESEYINAMQQILPMVPLDYIVKTRQELYPQFDEWLDLVEVNVYILLVLMGGVSMVSMTTALLVLVLDRTKMIGLLKALGMKDSGIFSIFYFLSVRIMLRGIFWGTLVALILCYIQKEFHIISLNQESYYMKWVPIHFPWKYILVINTGSVLLCFLSMIVPVITLLRISPLKAIRFE